MRIRKKLTPGSACRRWSSLFQTFNIRTNIGTVYLTVQQSSRSIRERGKPHEGRWENRVVWHSSTYLSLSAKAVAREDSLPQISLGFVPVWNSGAHPLIGRNLVSCA